MHYLNRPYGATARSLWHQIVRTNVEPLVATATAPLQATRKRVAEIQPHHQTCRCTVK